MTGTAARGRTVWHPRSASAAVLRSLADALTRQPQLDLWQDAGRYAALADALEKPSRCGWYPQRPKGWRP